MTTAHDFSQPTLQGEPRSLGDYRGHVLLLVNVASECGLTPQYEGLEALYRDKKNQGLVVLGFPCNQFGAQEPGTEADIEQFCTTKYDVTFPMFQKLEVNGEGAHPLYGWLTAQDVKPEGGGPVKWNFGKFLVSRRGDVIARFAPTVQPESPELLEAIEGALAVP
jgi:glutathione peroxidase